jgi:hypothetical protein
MNTNLKRCIAYLLIVTMLIGYIPKTIVFANPQNPVSNLSITDNSSILSHTYTFSLNWNVPQPAIDPGGGTNHETEGFEMAFRNATRGGGFNPAIEIPAAGVGTAMNHTFNNKILESGSIYMYRMVPFHHHIVQNPDGTSSAVRIRPPLDAPGQETLYMSDINVSAHGSGSNLTVTWENPTLDGVDVFTGYRIFHTQMGATAQPIPMESFTEVPINDPSLIRNADGTLTFVVEDPTLQMGSFYAVKVEPMIGNQLARTQNRITVGGRSFNFAYTPIEREFRTNEAHIRPTLYIEQVDSENIRLFWNSLRASVLNIDRIEIYSSLNEEFSPSRLIGTLSGTSAREINFWVTDMPTRPTFFKIIIFFEDANGNIQSMESEMVLFDPTYTDFTPYSPTVIDVRSNAAMPLSISVDWEAFVREPYNDIEEEQVREPYGYLDTNITYHVWITDDINNFDDQTFIADHEIATLDASLLEVLSTVDISGVRRLAYTSSFTEYVTRADNQFVRGALSENKIYYVKIVATRNINGQRSRPGIGSIFIPPTGDINHIPNDMANPPLRIKRDDYGVEMITENSITIEWSTRWFEVFNPENRSWYAKVGVDNNGAIVFGDAADATGNAIYLNDEAYIVNVDPTTAMARIRADLAALGASQSEIDSLPIRLIDLRDAGYEIHTVSSDFAAESGGYEQYLAGLVQNYGAWVTITGNGDNPFLYHTVTNQNAPTAANLLPNNSYLIFFRPFTEVEQRRTSFRPSFVQGTTLDSRGDINITPTVPVLIPVESGDQSVTFRWEYTEGLMYEIRFSHLIANYPDGGYLISSDDIAENGVIVNHNGVNYMYYTIEGLFPQTMYYIWIRAMSNTATSTWSNHISMYTTALARPNPPRGFGLGSRQSLRLINTENDRDLNPLGEDYITLEWTRKPNDTSDVTFGGVVSGGELLFSPNMENSHMVMFTGLIPNREYHFRIRTVLTVRRSGTEIIREYNYIVEMSTTRDFRDAVEIIAPPMNAPGNVSSNNFLQLESDWSDTLTFRTGRYDGEYDGDVDRDHFPLPTDDFEIIFDPITNTLTHRFRTNRVDSQGNNDNNVDQRFISRLIQNRTFVKEIDVTSYGNRVINNRVVLIPHSIISAFSTERITLRIIADNVTVDILPGAINTTEVNNIPNFGRDSMVEFRFSNNLNVMPIILPNQTYVSAPQSMEINIITGTETIPVTQLSQEINVQITLNDRSYMLDKNVGAYISTPTQQHWERMESEHNSIDGTINFTTRRLGSYSLIGKDVPNVISTYGTDPLNYINTLHNVFTSIAITDMAEFNPNQEITAVQFNNIVAAIAKGEPTVAMNATISTQNFQSLGRSGLLISGTHVPRQAGIHSLVRLYEIKTGTMVRVENNIANSNFSDINQAEERFRLSILKAEYLGFYEGSALRPQQNMTFGEFFTMLEIIIQDIGI